MSIKNSVRRRLFKSAVKQSKNASSNLTGSQITELIDEAVQWARITNKEPSRNMDDCYLSSEVLARTRKGQ